MRAANNKNKNRIEEKSNENKLNLQVDEFGVLFMRIRNILGAKVLLLF